MHAVAVVAVVSVILSLVAKAGMAHQAVLNYRRKSTKGVSLPFFVVGMLSYDSYTLQGILIRSWWLALAMSPGSVLALVILLQMYWYRPGRV